MPPPQIETQRHMFGENLDSQQTTVFKKLKILLILSSMECSEHRLKKAVPYSLI
jgi:hypothetical protein